MKPMTVSEMIAVLQAYERGEQIQWVRLNDADVAWADLSSGRIWNFNFNMLAYRAKPKPFVPVGPPELWVNVYAAIHIAYDSREKAMSARSDSCRGTRRYVATGDFIP